MTNSYSVRFLLAATFVAAFVVAGRVADLAATDGSQAAVQTEMQVVRLGTASGAGVALPGGSTISMPVEANGAGMIVGQVVDAGTGQPVSSAIVTLGGALGAGAARGGITMINGNISVGGAQGGNTVPRVITDAEGRFAFRSIPGGRFDLSAQKNGYLDGAYGRLRPNGAAQQVTLTDGERMTDVVVRMFRPAVVTGVVVDERSEPVVGADVRAYRRDLVSGRSQLVASNVSGRTDDRGMYRLSGLIPGDYVIAVPTTMTTMPADFSLQGRVPMDLMATMASTGGSGSISFGGGGAQVPGEDRFVLQNGGVAAEADGRLMAYPTVYYPSAGSVTTAETVAITSGEERGGVNITLPLRPTSIISGRVMGPTGPAEMYALHLVPSDTGDLSSDPSIATTVTTSDGSFAFLGVPAGSYVIQTVRVPRQIGRALPDGAGGERVMVFAAVGPGGGGPPPPPPTPVEDEPVLWTATPVTVSGTPVTGLAIALSEGIKVSGRIEFEGAAERPNATLLQRMLIVARAADGRQGPNLPPARISAEGQFTLPGLLPGRYVLTVANAPQGWNLKGVIAGDVDVSDVPLEVGTREVAGLVATLTDRTQSLAGTVRNAEGRLDDAAAVIVFPSDNRAWRDAGVNPRRMRLVRTSREGAFNFGGLPAGDYHLVAIADEVAGEWQDPRFLEMLTREATAISIGPGQEARQELTRRAVQPIGRAPVPAPTPWPAAAPAPSTAAIPNAGPWLEEDGTADRDLDPFVMDDAVIDSGSDAAEAPRQGQGRDARVDPSAAGPSGTATVSGVVMVEGDTPRPARRARVSLRAADQRVERAVMTDDEGRFTITGLPAGRYAVSVTKPAHVAGFFRSRPGRGPGAPLAVGAGQQINDLRLQIAPGGVIAGRIVDEQGQPFPGVSIRLMQYRTLAGERQLVPATVSGGPIVIGPTGNTVTDDRGEYRLFGLAPGEYIVSATAPARGSADLRQLSREDVQRVVADLKVPPARVPGGGAAPAPDPTPLGGRPVGYAPVYYPGSSISAQAVPVDVVAGQERRGVDMAVRLVPTAKISGSVVGPDGRPAAGTQIMVLQADQSVMSLGGMTSLVRTGDDGTFTTGPLPPGRYTVSARSGGGTQVMDVGGGGMFVSRMSVETAAANPDATPPVPLWAQAELDLSGQDVPGVSLQMQEGMTISGRLVFPQGSIPAPEDLSRVRLTLLPASSGRVVMGAGQPRIDADGTFAITGVIPGTYRLNATVPTSGFSATSRWAPGTAMVGDRDILDAGLTVEPGRDVSGLTVTFTDQTSEISGKLMDPAGQPVSDLTVLVFPTERAFWSPGSRRMRQPVQPGSDGEFRFTGLPPGDYFLAAVTELEPSAWGDPAVMDQIAAAAIKLTVGQGETKVQDIRLAGGG